MRRTLLGILYLSLHGVGSEECGPHLPAECDAAPRLQLPKRNASLPARSLGGVLVARFQDVVDKIDLSAARDHKLADNRKEDKQDWPFSAANFTDVPVTTLREPLTSAQKKLRRKVLARQAVTAAGLIMALMTFSVGMQLVMVEFVMTGTCEMPFNIAGTMGTVILGVIAAFRWLFHVPYRLLRGLCQHCSCLFCHCCLRRPYPAKAAMPLQQLCPEHLLEEVVGFLPIESLSTLSCASRRMQDLAHSENIVPTLLAKVKHLNLQKRWQVHLDRFEEASVGSELSDSMDTSQASVWTSSSVRSSGSARTSGSARSLKEKALRGRVVIKELHRFLCRHMRRSAAKEQAHEMQEQWNVMSDFVRYVMLVIGWFWFSAEVMDMACADDATGAFHILKALSSPAIFLFILESDRSQLGWQVFAGLCALILLMDLLFDCFRPLK